MVWHEWDYLELSYNKERVIIQCGKSETYEIIPARKISDNVVEHLQHSLQQVEDLKH